MGRGIPLGAESGFGVPCVWPWCLRWGHAWVTEAGVECVCSESDWSVCSWCWGCELMWRSWGSGPCMSPGRGTITSPSLGGQQQQWLLVITLVAEAASFLCRGGCWGSLQQTRQNPLVGKLPVFHTAEGLLSPRWPGLPVFSAEQAAGDCSGVCWVAYADVLHSSLFSAISKCPSWSPSPQWSFLCSSSPLVATRSCCRFLFDSIILPGQVSLVDNCLIIAPRPVHPPLFCQHLSLPVHFV